MLRNHRVALQIDLQRYFGLALQDILRGAIPLYMAAEYADRIPDGAELWKEIGGYRAWTVSEQMQATAIHQQQIHTWMQSQDGSKGRNRPKPLDPPKGRYEADIKHDALRERVKRHDQRRLERQERLKKLPPAPPQN